MTTEVYRGRKTRRLIDRISEDRHFQLPSRALTAEGAGEVFTIPQPDTINMQMKPMKSGLPLVVPFPRRRQKEPLLGFKKHAPLEMRELLEKLSVSYHGVEQALVFTFNKLQGVTAKRLVLRLNNIAQRQMGHMDVHKLFVALSRVHESKHLAIFPSEAVDLEYLCALRCSKQLRLWDAHYTTDGWWKTEPLVLTNADALFEEVDTRELGTEIVMDKVVDKVTKKVTKTTQRIRTIFRMSTSWHKNVCRALGIYYRDGLGDTKSDLADAIQPAWDEYFRKHGEQNGKKRKKRGGGRASKRTKSTAKSNKRKGGGKSTTTTPADKRAMK